MLTKHREALRDVHDKKLISTGSYEFLVKNGYIGLTQKGQAKYREIMASGDGPEELKEMFKGMTLSH